MTEYKRSAPVLLGCALAALVAASAPAALLADASGFIRAFERWCGSSPAAWRKENFLRQ